MPAPTTQRPSSLFRLTLLATLLAAQLGVAQAADPVSIDIPAQPLATALAKLAEQSGIKALYAAELLAGKTAPRVAGKLTSRQALEQLLAGSGLRYQMVGDDAVRIEAAPTAKTTELAPIEVRESIEPPSYVVRSSIAATRSDTPIERIPQTIVVVPQKLIRDQEVQNLAEAVENVSNVRTYDQRDISLLSGYRVRGFTASVLVDGVTVPGYFANQEPMSNIEQVEVLKGSTGSLYGGSQSVGAGGVGGSIAITSKAPDPEAHREVGVRLGSYNNRALNVDVNQPLSDTVAMRLVAEIQANDSETERLSADRKLLAPSLSWHPDEQRQLTVRLRHSRYDFLDFYGLPAEGTLTPGNGTLVTAGAMIPRDRIFTAEGMPDSEVTMDGLNVRWDQQLDARWSWSLTAAHHHVLFDLYNIYPWVEPYVIPTRMWEEMRSTTVSPSLTGHLDSGAARHTLVAGLDFDRTTDDAIMVMDMTMAGWVVPDYLNPSYPAWLAPASPAAPQQTNVYVSQAVYVQDQIDIGAWHLQAGLRHAQVKVDDVNPDWGFDYHTKSYRTSPRLGAVYEFTPQVSVFAGYGEGFKVPVTAFFNSPPKPEAAKQMEAGLRLTKLYGVNATLALFELTRENATVSGLDGFAYQVGNQRSRGFDLDLNWQASRALNVLAGFSQQTAEVIEDATAARVGKQLAGVPESTARLAARYDFQGDWQGLGVGLGAKYHSRLPLDALNSGFTPAATVFDAQASYQRKGLRVGLAINNLLDKKYFVPSTGGIAYVFPAPRRTLSVNASLSF